MKKLHLCSCLTSTRPQRKGSNSIYSKRHASEGAKRENRQQQQPLFLSLEPSFIPCSLQAVRGALQLTVSVPKQKTRMNKLSAFCQQVRKSGKSKKQRKQDQKRKTGRYFSNKFAIFILKYTVYIHIYIHSIYSI